jgi:flagellin
MPVLAPPPSVDQDINSRQYRDWFYSIYALIGKPGTTLGTMAYQNANSVAITGGAIGGVGISGSTINSTPIGQTSAAAGNFTTLEATASLKTDTLTGYLYGNGSGSNVSASTTIPSGSISGLGTMATQNANAVAITGGTISGVAITGSTIPYSNVTGTPTGVSATITTAKLTVAGTNGSMTFTNGILTSQTPAT